MKKIFIIEDDSDILSGLNDLFTSNDYEVETNDSMEELEEIIKKIEKFQPDIVVLDIVLPKLDGLEIIKKIKENDKINNAEIFIFTDLSDEDSRSRSVGLGANYYFLKSEFDIYTFSNKVMRITDREEASLIEDENNNNESDLVLD
jgi:DNA-binding response OmpR family regulator